MKPILFNTEMVRAILDGRKTQTRIVIKIPYPHTKYCEQQSISIFSGAVGCKNCGCYHWDDAIKQKYQIGDVLWVRETWCYGRVVGDSDEYGKSEFWLEQTQKEEDEKRIFYKADMDEAIKEGITFEDVFWKPSIHIPEEYARIFLRVTNVKVERLRDISYDDIYNEGYTKDINIISEDFENDKMLQWWAKLWNSTAKYGYKYLDNPYVFVYEFEKAEKPKDSFR